MYIPWWHWLAIEFATLRAGGSCLHPVLERRMVGCRTKFWKSESKSTTVSTCWFRMPIVDEQETGGRPMAICCIVKIPTCALLRILFLPALWGASTVAKQSWAVHRRHFWSFLGAGPLWRHRGLQPIICKLCGTLGGLAMKLTKDRQRIDKDVDVRSWCRKSDVFMLENLSVFVSFGKRRIFDCWINDFCLIHTGTVAWDTVQITLSTLIGKHKHDPKWTTIHSVRLWQCKQTKVKILSATFRGAATTIKIY